MHCTYGTVRPPHQHRSLPPARASSCSPEVHTTRTHTHLELRVSTSMLRSNVCSGGCTITNSASSASSSPGRGASALPGKVSSATKLQELGACACACVWSWGGRLALCRQGAALYGSFMDMLEDVPSMEAGAGVGRLWAGRSCCTHLHPLQRWRQAQLLELLLREHWRHGGRGQQAGRCDARVAGGPCPCTSRCWQSCRCCCCCCCCRCCCNLCRGACWLILWGGVHL